MAAFNTKKGLKEMLAETKHHLEKWEIFDTKTIVRTMKILEADAWVMFWTEKREELLSSDKQKEDNDERQH